MRAAFLYTWDWSHEFRDYAASLVPSHRLFGAAEMPEHGIDVLTCTWGRVPSILRQRQSWKIWQALWAVGRQPRVDCFVATTEASALPVLAFRAVRLLRKPVLVICVGTLTDKYLDGRGLLRRVLLRRADRVVVLASGQVALMSRALGVREPRIRFIPFGVDTDYFDWDRVVHPRELMWEVAAAGTNEGKDFGTLVAALAPGERCLIVTDEPNATVARQTPTAGVLTLDHDVPIALLKERYVSSGKIVIPLKDIAFSSGQTVLLENLSLGRSVIVSDTMPIRDYVSPEVATLVPPGDVGAMRNALDREAPDYLPEAAEHVRQRFSIGRFARELAALCREAAEESSGA